MFHPAANPAAAYRTASVDTRVLSASPHQLVALLFDGLLQSVHAARGALQRADVPAKGQQIGRAVRILEEGLKAGLDLQQGGQVAATLQTLYSYCIQRLTDANLHGDAAALDEVARLIGTVAEGWQQISPLPASATAAAATAAPAAPGPGSSGWQRLVPASGAAAYALGA